MWVDDTDYNPFHFETCGLRIRDYNHRGFRSISQKKLGRDGTGEERRDSRREERRDDRGEGEKRREREETGERRDGREEMGGEKRWEERREGGAG
jgi:hypothetical protein